MRVLAIALKDLHIFFTDRGALSYLFLLPLIFIVLFAGLASSGVGTAPAEEADRVPLLVVNEDGDTPAVAALIDELNDAGGIVVRLADRAEAQEALRHGQTRRVLVIPAGFSAEFAAAAGRAAPGVHPTPTNGVGDHLRGVQGGRTTWPGSRS